MDHHHGLHECHDHEHPRGWSPVGPRRRWLEPFLLLLLAAGPAHGYSLLQRLNELGLAADELDVGQLYRTLRELEDTGSVRSRWDEPDIGATRRQYEITDVGLARLHDWAYVMAERGRLVTEFISRYEGLSLDEAGAHKPQGGS